MQWSQRALAAVVLAAGLALAIPAAAARTQTLESVRSYNVDLRIEAGGTLLVTERIGYDFGFEQRHGIFRDLPVRSRYDGRYDRVYPVHVLGVAGSPGTPDQYKVEDADAGTLRIRIGDPDRTISGRHSYTIVYRVEGSLNGFADHDELSWNAIGTQWQVPIEHASVKVSAPAAISRVACYAGPLGTTTPCASSRSDGRTAFFAVTSLSRNQGVTVVVGLPTGVVPAPRPILDERWSLARAFAATPGALTVAGGVLLAVLLVLGWLLGITGRDRRPGGAPPPGAGVVVESAPPEGIRPTQAGLLVDEVVRPVAVTASLVDLAVRGYLRIEELTHHPVKPDWRLVKLKAADEDLLGYERMLLDGLFASRGTQHVQAVRLSDLEERFYDRFERIRSWLYADAVRRRWFTAHPDEVRRKWLVRGRAVTVVGAALLALLVWRTHFGLAAIPVLLAGPAVIVGARRMPARTPVGAALLRRVSGFRTYLETAGIDRASPARAADQFSPYLPYAIVFGLTEQWTRTFALVGAPPQTAWYEGREPFSPDRFPSHIDRFASSSAETLSAPPRAVSGSSGFNWGFISISWDDGGDDSSRDGRSWDSGRRFWGGGGSSGGGSSGGGGGGGSW